MREKIVLALVSALAGGAFHNVMESQKTAGRLEAIERSIVRIEAQVFRFSPDTKKADRE